MASIFNFFSSLLAKIAAFAQWVLDVFLQIFIDLWNVLTDLIAWCFESVLGVASGALNAISIPFDPQTYYALIPPDVGNMLGVIGITQAIAMIVASLLIRFLLQTIPFVRWGS